MLLGTCSRAVVCCVLCAPSGAVVASRLSLCLGCGGQRAFLACLVAPCGVLHLVPSGCSRCFEPLYRHCGAFLSPEACAPALLGGAAGHAEAGRVAGSLCLPLAPAKAGALGSFRFLPVHRPSMGLSLTGPSSVGVARSALRCLACVDPETDVSGFPYRPSFHGGLSRCTGAVSCGCRHIPFRVGGPHARVLCVYACAHPSWPGRATRPLGRVVVRLTFSFGRFLFLLCSASSGLGLPFSCSFICLPPTHFFSFFVFFALVSLRPSVVSCCLRMPWALALCFSLLPAPSCVVFFSYSLSLFAPIFSGFLSFRAPGALGFGAVCCLCCCPSASRLSVRSRCFSVSCPAFFVFLLCSCLLDWRSSAVLAVFCPPPPLLILFIVLVSCCSALCLLLLLLRFPPWPLAAPWCLLRPPPSVSRGFRRCCSVLHFSFFLCCFAPACLLGARRRFSPSAAPPPPLVCFAGLPLLGTLCGIAAFVLPAWPLAAPWWLLPPPAPPVLCLAVLSLPLGARFFLSSAAFLMPACLAHLGGSRRLPPPPPAVPVWCLVLSPVAVVPCCRVPRCVSCCGASPCCAVGCCALCSVCWGVCLCVVCAVSACVRCCAALLRVVPPGVVLLCAELFCL